MLVSGGHPCEAEAPTDADSRTTLPKHRGGSGLYKTYGLFILLRIEFLGAAHRFHSVAAVVISAYHIGVFLC